MATSPNLTKLTEYSQTSLTKLARVILDIHKRLGDWRYKLLYIDVAYARYCATRQYLKDGVDITPAERQNEEEECGINKHELTVPIVTSQVDSYVAYLSEVFLSGYPLFPVVSDPANIVEAEALQAVIDEHSVRGRYIRQLLLGLKANVKYNLSATEVDWCAYDDYSVLNASDAIKKEKKIDLNRSYFNRLRDINMYNFVFDPRVRPVDIPTMGEWAGDLEIISRIELKRRLAYIKGTGYDYNSNQGLKSKLSAEGNAGTYPLGYFFEMPQISELLGRKNWRQTYTIDWVTYLTGEKENNPRLQNMSDIYEWFTLYARIVPGEHGINVPRKDVPQVWKLCFVNHQKLVYAARVYSIYDTLPIYVSQMMEDNFELQTQSVAEGSTAFQEAASKLFAIRMNGARRAIMDRALYDPALINPSDINAPFPAPKIPVRDNSLLAGRTLEMAYYQIPFDSRGTETVVQDLGQVVNMADKLQGINAPIQGQFQKGNKTRKEWDDTMAGSGSRMRLCALSIEYSQYLPIKEQIKLNIYQYEQGGSYQNIQTGTVYKIDSATLQSIREKISHFKLADGYTPAEKLASSDVLQQGMMMINQSPILQQGLGPSLPMIWMHLMSLGGVTGLQQYMPKPGTMPALAPPAAAPPAK